MRERRKAHNNAIFLMLETLEPRALLSGVVPLAAPIRPPLIAALRVPLPLSPPLTITTRYGNELMIQGSPWGDQVLITQSGETLTIIANTITSTWPSPDSGLFVYGNGGGDNITIDASVTARVTVVDIGGIADKITANSLTTYVWADSIDIISGIGYINKVTVFDGGVSKAPGDHLAEPIDAGSTIVATSSLWGTGAT